MGSLTSLPNIGTELEQQLHEVGIHTPEELRQEGSRNAWLRIQKMDSSACIHRLYALEAAVRNIKKKELSKETKSELTAFYQEHKR